MQGIEHYVLLRFHRLDTWSPGSKEDDGVNNYVDGAITCLPLLSSDLSDTIFRSRPVDYRCVVIRRVRYRYVPVHSLPSILKEDEKPPRGLPLKM